MLKYLIICPLIFMAGFIDAIAGGGGLISLPAYMIAGLPAHNAIACNKMSSCMGTTVSAYRYAKSGYMDFKLAICCIPFAFAGSSTGANLALLISDTAFKWIILFVIPITAVYILSPKTMRDDLEPLPFKKMLMLSIVITFVIGVYDGFYGPGTGTFLLLCFTAIAHMKVVQANGLTKAINLSTNAAALSVFLLNGKVILPLGIIAGLCNMAGNYLGSSVFSKKGSTSVKPIMIVVLVVFFIKTLTELL